MARKSVESGSKPSNILFLNSKLKISKISAKNLVKMNIPKCEMLSNSLKCKKIFCARAGDLNNYLKITLKNEGLF